MIWNEFDFILINNSISTHTVKWGDRNLTANLDGTGKKKLRWRSPSAFIKSRWPKRKSSSVYRIYNNRCVSPQVSFTEYLRFLKCYCNPSQVWNTSHYYNVAFDLTGSIAALRRFLFQLFNLEVICVQKTSPEFSHILFKIKIFLNVECRKLDDKCIRKSTNMHCIVSIILKLDWEQREGNKIHLNRESKLNNVATQQRMCKCLHSNKKIIAASNCDSTFDSCKYSTIS